MKNLKEAIEKAKKNEDAFGVSLKIMPESLRQQIVKGLMDLPIEKDAYQNTLAFIFDLGQIIAGHTDTDERDAFKQFERGMNFAR